MRISRLGAQNFRALRAVSIPSTSDVNVIVGPNAIGKSTLLDVVRLPKVMLAPRFHNEGQNALVQMGALSPHNQAIGAPGVDIAAMANNPDLPIVLTIDLILSEDDVADLKSDINNVALLLLHSESIQAGTDSPLAFTQFLSTPEGQKRLADKIEEFKSRISRVISGQNISLVLTMDHSQRTIKGGDNFSQAIITILDRRLPNYKTLFSLFPADRTFPQGDQAIQFGAGDAQQQLQSHMSTPTMKYARLKQTIIQNIMLSQDGREMIENEFNLIFDNLLPGKKLAGISMNQLGLLKILVRDIDAQKVFDIDQMSSGEKGLVLTFLFLRLSMQKGGIVLLDEPELHLNAAVQAKILNFLIDHCVNPLSLQVFLCTHSPEIYGMPMKERIVAYSIFARVTT